MAIKHSESSDARQRSLSGLHVETRDMAIFHARTPTLHPGCPPIQPGIVCAWSNIDRGRTGVCAIWLFSVLVERLLCSCTEI